ncbi:MAG: hypothetical protein ABL925_01435 [Methylococcales bacterium]
MTEKTASKYLLNLEKHFAIDNPVLLKASKVFHELDQIEYDMGLIEADETTACKNSWWPIISLIGGNSTAKSRFVNSYLGSDQSLSGIQASSHKYTVLLHNNQATPVTLPGTALDVDPRYPFYQISRKIEQRQKGEGSRINSYLELKTLDSNRLKGKLFVDAPNINANPNSPVSIFLTQHIIEHSDLVMIFTDTFDSPSPMLKDLIENIIIHQDSNKFVYLIDEPVRSLSPISNNELISSWQRKLSDVGLNTGQFIVVPNQDSGIDLQNHISYITIDQRMANVAHVRSYRVLNALNNSIDEIDNVIVPEVKKAIQQWKERATFSSLIILGFLATLAIFAEIGGFGVLELLIDPIIGPITILAIIIVMVPLHLLFSKLQAKPIINQLHARQKELSLLENLANIFENNITISRMLLPISEPVGWNKKTKARIALLAEKTKELVQSLNDSFSTYNEHLFQRGDNDSRDF